MVGSGKVILNIPMQQDGDILCFVYCSCDIQADTPRGKQVARALNRALRITQVLRPERLTRSPSAKEEDFRAVHWLIVETTPRQAAIKGVEGCSDYVDVRYVAISYTIPDETPARLSPIILAGDTDGRSCADTADRGGIE